MENKQTAVEFLEEKYRPKGYITAEEFAQAKEMEKDQIMDAVSSPTEMSDESWEGCDGCTEQDELMYKNGYIKGYNAAISELPKESSDEEINKLATKHILYNDSKRQWVIEGMKLYREQLKVKI